MSWWTDTTKPIRKTEDHIHHGLKHLDSILRSHGAPDMYIGTSTNGENYNINTTSLDGQTTLGQTTQRIQTNFKSNGYKPIAFKRNVAQQGGMTKKEVQEYNQRHPNETAIGAYNE